MYYLLIYDVVDDYMERRQPFRNEHLALTRQFSETGELILGGALADPTDGALLVWRTDSTGPIERFVEADPYVQNGVVTKWTIRKWTVVTGCRAE